MMTKSHEMELIKGTTINNLPKKHCFPHLGGSARDDKVA